MGSTIEWTDETWNPVTGCSKVSPGCAHCYAEELTMRFAKTWGVPGLPWTPANAAENVLLRPERLEQPLHWRKPRMVFVNSMSDLFHEEIPDSYIEQVFGVMMEAEQHTFQVLTKRPERMHEFMGDALPGYWPPPNVWLGVSIENRRFVHRAELLRQTPAAVRFISAEPLLGPLVYDSRDGETVTAWGGNAGWERVKLGERCWSHGKDVPEFDLTGIDWLIVGGESGPRHRPVKPEWVRDLRDATRCLICGGDGGRVGDYDSAGDGSWCDSCEGRGASTAFFFKQWGGRTPKAGGRELDGRTWDEFPVVREREEVAA